MRHSTRGRSHFRVRLACVKHAASVQSEPESNSPVQICTKISAWQKSESQSSISTRSSLVNEPEKEFFTPAVFCGVCKHALLSPHCQQLFGNLQKTFCEDFLKPRCFMRRGKLLRSSLLPVNSFSFFFPEIFFPEPSEKGCFRAANATFTLPGRKCQSLFLKNSKKAAPVCRGIRITPLPEYESLPYYLATTRVCPTWRCSPSSLFQRFKSSTLTLSFLEICHRLSFACTL